MSSTQTTAPIAISLTVPLLPDDAFRLFTDRMGTWWPTETHSIAEDKVTDVVFEQRQGGEVYEIAAGGVRNHWAQVVAWDPPRRVILAWKPNPDRVAATEVEVTFTPEGTGTRVALEHRGWERLGDEAATARAHYGSAGGWPLVIERYEKAAG